MPITLNLLLAAIFFIVAAACIVPMQGLKGDKAVKTATSVFFIAGPAGVLFSILYLVSLFAM